jgi:hypothetical protein
VRAAALVVRFETLCEKPRETLGALVRHCVLPDTEPLIEQYADRIRYPSYYQTSFSPRELSVIREETAATASLWGY